MFRHQHPYEIYIPRGTRRVIIGTLPPPRFSMNELRERDVNFCYGSCDGMLWPVLDRIFNLSLRYDNSPEAVTQRKQFLKQQRLGICDIVDCCSRRKIDASDLGMEDIQLRDILFQLESHKELDTLIFTGGNTKNGPEYLFRKQLREHGLKLTSLCNTVPRKHTFFYAEKKILTVSLTSPSNAANRAIGSNPLYKMRKKLKPDYTTFDFRVEQYREVFLNFT